MQRRWGTLNPFIIQDTRVSLYPRTSQMVNYFISWMRIARKWNSITLSHPLIPELEVLIIPVYGLLMDQFLIHFYLVIIQEILYSQVSPFFLGESRFWRCALLSCHFWLKLGFMIKLIYFLLFEQNLIPWYSTYP